MAARRGLGSWWFAAAWIALSAPAWAQTAPAEGLFQGARDALKQGDYERACRLFRESDRIEPAIGTKFNLADCEERRGRVATAWGLFRVVAQDPSAGKDRTRIADERARALAARIARLTLALQEGAPKDTFVRIGETEISAGGMGAPIPLDPGRHELAIGAPGRQERRVAVEIVEAKDQTVEIFPGPPSETAAAVPPPAALPPPIAVPSQPQAPARDPAPAAGRPVLGWVLGGIGLAGIAAGAVTGVRALGKKSDGDAGCSDTTRTCTQAAADANDAARTLSVASTVTFIAGGALLGAGGLVLWLGGTGEAKSSKASLTISPGALRVARSF